MGNTSHRGSEEARNELPSLIEEAENGHSTIITRRGRAVAAIVPVETYRATHRQRSLLRLEGSGRGQWGKSSVRTLRQLRDEWSR